MSGLLQDLRYALRQLRKSPGFTAVAVLTLALGIAANTVIFSVMNVTVLKRLGFPDPDRLMLIWQTFGNDPNNTNIISAPNFWDFRRMNHVFEDVAIFDSAGRGYNLAANGSHEPERVSGLRVSASFFNVLGVQPFLGRTFLREEEIRGKDHEVILSYGLWKRRYGADRGLIGKTIRIDGDNFTVIGVMPRQFHWQFWSDPRQLWVPVGYTPGDYERGGNSFIGFGRLKSGVTVEQARAEMENIGAQLRLQYPKEDANISATVQPMSEFEITGLRTTMAALLAAVGFVLLIACVNIANLLLARASARQKELALRRALGASGLRIARQALTESTLLALIGGACGVLLAAWCTSILPLILPRQVTQLPVRELESIPIDVRVLGFALLISVLTGILFGFAPAVHAVREGVSDSLKEGGRGPATGRNRVRQMLVAAEVGLALMVLCGAGLMIESVARLLGVELGFNPKNVLTMSMTLPQEDLYNGPPGVPRFCEELTERVAAIPGVMDVGAVAHLPLDGGAGRSFVVEGRPDPGPGDRPGADYSVACPGYFRTMGVRILRGREFSNQDNVDAAGVIVIDQAMAQKIWPGEDPIGRAIDLGGPGGQRLTVMGEVADMRHRALDESMHPQFFRPYTQASWPWMSIVIRTQGAPESYAPGIKKALAEVEPDRPVSEADTMENIVQDALGPRRFPTILLASFALLALILSAVGIVGIVGYSVAQRTQEIGIRMALGARPRDVLALVLRGSMTWVFVGIVLGIAGSLSLTRLLGILLYGIKPTDPEVLGTASLLLGAVAFLASYIPARRAAKVDPMVALRYE